MDLMNFVITTDSTCDLPLTYLTSNGITILPMSYSIEGKSYVGLEGQGLTSQEFYDKLRGGAISQSVQVNPAQAEDFFEEFLQSGRNVLHIAFSSALSGSCSSAMMAAEVLNDKYDDRKVVVIDSLCASLGQGLLVHYAVLHKQKGENLDEIAQWLNQNKLKICHNFTVNDLFHLHRGGRVSKAAAIVGSMLGVKPVLHVNNEGKLVPVGKVRGRKQSITALVDYMEKTIGNNKNEIVFISHGDCFEEAEMMAQMVRERFGIENFLINSIGPVVGTHSGPGTIALFYVGDHR